MTNAMVSGIFCPAAKESGLVTGKSLSEVLIYSSINPQYDNTLFIDLQVQYEKIPRAEHV